MNQIYTQHWVSLPKEVRQHLIKVFGIVRTGVTEIRDSEVVSDGHTNDDLKAISLEKMNEYIGSTETFARAWEITLAKVHSELHPPVGEIATDGKVIPVEEKPWCDTCDSKGVRHKKDCPKYVAIEHHA